MLDEHRLAALVYPTLRRKPARIGDAQGGTNCQLSSHSGSAGARRARRLHRRWRADRDRSAGRARSSEPQLLSLGYAIEQTLKLRRPPFSTPALVDGKAPAPKTFATPLEENRRSSRRHQFSYDETTGRLSYKSVFAPAVRDRTAMWMHRLGGTRPVRDSSVVRGAATSDRFRDPVGRRSPRSARDSSACASTRVRIPRVSTRRLRIAELGAKRAMDMLTSRPSVPSRRILYDTEPRRRSKTGASGRRAGRTDTASNFERRCPSNARSVL